MNLALVIFWIAAATIVAIAVAVIYSAVQDLKSADEYKCPVDNSRR